MVSEHQYCILLMKDELKMSRKLLTIQGVICESADIDKGKTTCYFCGKCFYVHMHLKILFCHVLNLSGAE